MVYQIQQSNEDLDIFQLQISSSLKEMKHFHFQPGFYFLVLPALGDWFLQNQMKDIFELEMREMGLLFFNLGIM